MKEWLYPGSKVVCVEGTGGLFVSGVVETGRIYVVRDVGRHVEGGIGCRLVGITAKSTVGIWNLPDGSIVPCNGDMFFRASRFRPLQKRKTSIEIFKRMLTDAPNQKERLDA